MKTEPAFRIRNYSELDDGRVCYWKAGGEWMIYLPGCGIGRLSLHTVQEHEDGTITATPSIMMRGHQDGEPTARHGYLTRGAWNEC